MKPKLPTTGDQIASMQLDARFEHVRRHLYNEPERWRDIVDGLPVPASARARAAGCSDRAMGRGRVHVERLPPACIEQVLEDHDEYYEPAYRAALETACERGRIAPAIEDARSKLRAVGDNGVFLYLRRNRSGAAWVSSAIRVRPRGTPRPSRRDFFNAAVRKLRDTTSWK